MRGQLARISELRQSSGDSMDFKNWKQITSLYIDKIFGDNSKNLKAFEGIRYFPTAWTSSMNESYWYPRCFNSGLDEAEILLNSAIRELAFFGEEDEKREQQLKEIAKPSSNKKVFIVHGHDEKLKVQVAQFLEQLGLQPVILHQQANQGLTIIEKFEKHSDVSFAVVLLTPDDAGGKLKAKEMMASFLRLGPEMETETMKARARQNVIFEFGFFLGKLGRAKVCGLYCEGVELPSDYDGVLYTKVDATNSWQQELLKELRATGFAVDAARLA